MCIFINTNSSFSLSTSVISLRGLCFCHCYLEYILLFILFLSRAMSHIAARGLSLDMHVREQGSMPGRLLHIFLLFILLYYLYFLFLTLFIIIETSCYLSFQRKRKKEDHEGCFQGTLFVQGTIWFPPLNIFPMHFNMCGFYSYLVYMVISLILIRILLLT